MRVTKERHVCLLFFCGKGIVEQAGFNAVAVTMTTAILVLSSFIIKALLPFLVVYIQAKIGADLTGEIILQELLLQIA